jgi:hypothetical protein
LVFSHFTRLSFPSLPRNLFTRIPKLNKTEVSMLYGMILRLSSPVKSTKEVPE